MGLEMGGRGRRRGRGWLRGGFRGGRRGVKERSCEAEAEVLDGDGEVLSGYLNMYTELALLV